MGERMTDDEKFVATVEKLASKPAEDWMPDTARRKAWVFRSLDQWRYSDILWAATEAVREVDPDTITLQEAKLRLFLLESVAGVILSEGGNSGSNTAILAAVAEIAQRAGKVVPKEARLAPEVHRRESELEQARAELRDYCRERPDVPPALEPTDPDSQGD